MRKKKEFRFHKTETIKNGKKKRKGWHPAYIFLEKGNIYIYVTITHSKKVDGLILVKMKQNPNPKDKRESYFVAKIRMDTKDNFSRRHEDWLMLEEDDMRIRELFKDTKKDDSVLETSSISTPEG